MDARRPRSSRSRCCPGKIYMTPSGYKVRIEKHPGAPSWRLIGTVGEGALLPQALHRHRRRQERDLQVACATTCIYGPIFVADLDKDLELVAADLRPRLRRPLEARRKRARLRAPQQPPDPQPAALARQRDQAADPLGRLHRRVQRLAGSRSPTTSTRSSSSSSGSTARSGAANWREHFGVDIVNGFPGHELKCDRPQAGRHVPARRPAGRRRRWRTFKLRQDFAAAAKSRPRTTSPPRSSSRPTRLAASRPRPPAREPTSSPSTASTACSSGPTTPSTAASTSRPRPTWRGRTTSSPTSSR